MPSVFAARRNTSDRNTLPWSITTVSGTITGFAAASAIRVSREISRWCGIRDADIASAASQPGRISSGTVTRASSSAASTAFAPTGRNTPAQIVRVAMSIARTSSARPMTPSSMTAMTSSGVLSIWTCSPGRFAVVTA